MNKQKLGGVNYQCYQLGNVRIKDGSALLNVLDQPLRVRRQNFQHEFVKPRTVSKPVRRYISRNQETDNKRKMTEEKPAAPEVGYATSIDIRALMG